MPRRRTLALLTALAALGAQGVLLAPAIAGRADDPPRLDAIVGTNDAFDITLNDASGARVARLPAGTYTVVVHDRSRIHNFHLASEEDRSVDFRTDLEFVGDQAFTVAFKPGVRYVYACEPHWQTMWGDFVTTSGESPGTTTTVTTAPPPRPRLLATVTAAGRTSLQPRMVAHGAVRITVRDRSHRHGFVLSGPGVSRRTSRAFMGTAVWNVRLATGTYRYGSNPASLKNVLTVH
jgi:hypothetical protein